MHAHLISGPPVRRAILMSGSLYLTSPMAHSLGKGILQACELRAQELEGKSLRDCSQKIFKQILTENNLSRCWMQEENILANWETKAEQVEELMIGDTEFEVFHTHHLKVSSLTRVTVCNLASRYRNSLAFTDYHHFHRIR